MKKTFPGYYPPTEAEFSEVWNECLFALDANVLLNFYRYSQATTDELIGILDQISGRLWVPYQAALEYQRRRPDVIALQVDAHVNALKLLEKLGSELLSLRRDADGSLEGTKSILTEVGKELGERKQEYLDLLNNDYLRDTTTSLFEGKVGSPYSREQLDEIYEKGKARYDQAIPPGYLDANDKEGNRQYGDLVLWFQVIDKAKETKRPIILVTDDRKEDWWLRRKGRTIGPRPELIEEIRSKADVLFYMYQADPFMEHARQYIERRVPQEAIDEVRDIRRRDEQYMEAVQAAALRFPTGVLAQAALAASQIPTGVLAQAALAASQIPTGVLAQAALAASQVPTGVLAQAALAASQIPTGVLAQAALAASQVPTEALAQAALAASQIPTGVLAQAALAASQVPTEALAQAALAVSQIRTEALARAVLAASRIPKESPQITTSRGIPLDSAPEEEPDGADEQPGMAEE